MKKRAFKPQTVIRHLEQDFDLGQDIKVEFWKDPSRKVIFDLFDILGKSTRDSLDELKEIDKERLDQRYFECAAAIMLDCDIEEIDLSTPDGCRAAFDDERLPWGIFHEALMSYLGELIETHDKLKNVLRRVSKTRREQEEVLNSGTESEREEEE